MPPRKESVRQRTISPKKKVKGGVQRLNKAYRNSQVKILSQGQDEETRDARACIVLQTPPRSIRIRQPNMITI
ncbi:hypothetical protein DSUL_20406 [Desulfovibrionales bacterium]